ncbi:Syntaxin-binding protein 5, partial [Characodon lateralis]|nr:Syntaxin-binding protein 5 [Characodon lateralis]
SSKSHPGPVVHISDNPMDEGKLIIGFESGIVVLWDLKSKKADYRYTYDEKQLSGDQALIGLGAEGVDKEVLLLCISSV